MKGLSNVYIHKVLRGRVKDYIGVFSSNNIPATRRQKILFICNLSRYNEPGTHFVGVMIDKRKKKAEYFDTYGLPCINHDILLYLDKYVNRVQYIKNQIQHLNSNYCGVHCMAYILSKKINMSMKQFIKIYKNNNLHRNDDISLQFISSVL